MADTKMNREFPDREQRYAVCLSYADRTASKHDPRSTPAPKKDRIKGSPRNKPGSARPGGKVTFSESVTKSLQNKVKNHNEKSDRKGDSGCSRQFTVGAQVHTLLPTGPESAGLRGRWQG